MDPPTDRLPAADLDLDSFVDDSLWEFVKEMWNGSVRFYTHRGTRRPMCLTKGSSRHDLTFVGVILFCRPPQTEKDGCQNIKMECTVEQASMAVTIVGNMYDMGRVLDTEKEMQDSFEAAYVADMSRRRMVGVKRPLTPEPPALSGSDDERPAEPERKKPRDTICAVCLDRPANTTTSCLHTVVCQDCSDDMAAHPEKYSASHCVICDQRLTAVYESNGDVRKIEPECVVLDEEEQ